MFPSDAPQVTLPKHAPQVTLPKHGFYRAALNSPVFLRLFAYFLLFTTRFMVNKSY